MLRYQITTVLRKPQIQVKLAVITLLFCLNIYDQIGIVTVFAEYMGGEGELTVAAFLCHIFNYLDLYQMVIFVGFILLLPDIVCEEYMERRYLMLHKSRRQAAGTAWLRLFVFSALYVLWLVFLTVLISGIKLRNFSLEWPHFLTVMIKQHSQGGGEGSVVMSLVMLPKGALEYSPVVVAGLVVLRTFLGFLFLAGLACLLRLLTGKVRNGIVGVVVLIAYSGFIYSWSGGWLKYYSRSAGVYQAERFVDLIKTTIIPFFTFRSMTDDFTEWLRYGIITGLVLVVMTGLGIACYYKKGDLGDADRTA